MPTVHHPKEVPVKVAAAVPKGVPALTDLILNIRTSPAGKMTGNSSSRKTDGTEARHQREERSQGKGNEPGSFLFPYFIA